MNLGMIKGVAGYLAASVAALTASVKLACVLGSQMLAGAGGNIFR